MPKGASKHCQEGGGSRGSSGSIASVGFQSAGSFLRKGLIPPGNSANSTPLGLRVRGLGFRVQGPVLWLVDGLASHSLPAVGLGSAGLFHLRGPLRTADEDQRLKHRSPCRDVAYGGCKAEKRVLE